MSFLDPDTHYSLFPAHVIENRSSKRFQAVHALQARHRWCLTGTPIQNRLEDLSALVEFLRVNPFDNPREFRRVFLEPIDRQDSKGWDRLRSLVQAISLRRTKAALEQEIALPPPQTVTCQVSLDVEERRAYNLVKRRCAMAIDSGGGQINTFQLILRLRQICNHGVDLLPTNLREWLQLTSRFGIHVPLQPEICESCGLAIQEVDEAAFEVLSCVHQICRTCRLEARKELDLDGALGLACPMCQMTMRRERCEQDSLLPRSVSYRPSSKVRALLQNLDEDKRMAIAAGLPPEKRFVSLLEYEFDQYLNFL
jgi:SNF2 family DNA or RNA helicase